jgi:pyruvate/2-oxoglutarate dehydrogenase complex dihydrolipoamide acyltransferase (E2) component
MNRRLVAASAAVGRERDTIHLIAEVDVAEPRRLMAQHRARTGERLSFTAYVVSCLARVCSENPDFNAFRRGRDLVLLDDITISVLHERVFEGKAVPEPVGIRSADRKTYRQLHDELRAAQNRPVERLGAASGAERIRFIPSFLLRTFIRLASRSIAMQKRYGVIGVTSIGMFGSGTLWPLPLTSATVTAAIGTIVPRVVLAGGRVEQREHLCVTLSFDHDLIDGAAAARFSSRFAAVMSGAEPLRGELGIR